MSDEKPVAQPTQIAKSPTAEAPSTDGLPKGLSGGGNLTKAPKK